MCPLASVWVLQWSLPTWEQNGWEKGWRRGKSHIYFPVFFPEGFYELAACFLSLFPSSVNNSTLPPPFSLWLAITSAKGLGHSTLFCDFHTFSPYIVNYPLLNFCQNTHFWVCQLFLPWPWLLQHSTCFVHNLLLYLFGIAFHITFFSFFHYFRGILEA